MGMRLHTNAMCYSLVARHYSARPFPLCGMRSGTGHARLAMCWNITIGWNWHSGIIHVLLISGQTGIQ